MFFNDTATTEIYTLSLHDALPIFERLRAEPGCRQIVLSVNPANTNAQALYESLGFVKTGEGSHGEEVMRLRFEDRKSTRLNSSHANISYAVFCLKKKNTIPCAAST